MRFAAIFIAVWGLMWGMACAEVITGVSANVAGAESHVVITRNASGPAPKIFQIPGENPRVVMDWTHADARMPSIPAGALGHVKAVRHSRRGDTGLRVVLDLVPGASLSGQAISPSQINLHVIGPAFTLPAVMTAPKYTDRFFEGATPFPRLQPRKIQNRGQSQGQKFTALTKPAAKPRKPIVVIDAGHGGKDPGSIGRAGTYEKTITLKAAKELRRQLLATGKYQVILTRDDDTYIAHEKRIRIARAGKGDLFISIHADSTKGSTARGASVYTLADRAKTRTKEVVNSQNWIMDVDLTEQSDSVGDILVDLAQRKTSSQSELFADMLLKPLSKSTRLVGNSHRRAGYFVLLAPDVPAVLLELGFLSNSQDEALLKTSAHRKKVMRSVVTAINGYFGAQKS